MSIYGIVNYFLIEKSPLNVQLEQEAKEGEPPLKLNTQRTLTKNILSVF